MKTVKRVARMALVTALAVIALNLMAGAASAHVIQNTGRNRATTRIAITNFRPTGGGVIRGDSCDDVGKCLINARGAVGNFSAKQTAVAQGGKAFFVNNTF